MDIQSLQRQIAYLESLNDQLMTELTCLNQLFIDVGFEDGLSAIKAAAEEAIKEEEYDDEAA